MLYRFKFLALSVVTIFGFHSQLLASDSGYKIKGYVSTGPNARHVVIEGGRLSGVVSGEMFRAVRPAKPGVSTPVETGVLKVIMAYDHESVAEVIHQGTDQSQAIYGAFSDVMAGDVAMAQRINISRAKIMAPEIVIRYSTLFDDPKANPSTFELTRAGRNHLKSLAEEISRLKSGMLLVEGHTDQKGSSEDNQIESYQRALTIRQALIEDFGFDETRVTALGLGESEPVSNVLLPGNADRARRIVLKVVPMVGGNQN